MKWLRTFLLVAMAVGLAGCIQVNIPKIPSDFRVSGGNGRGNGDSRDTGQLPDVSDSGGGWRDLLWSIGGQVVGGEQGFLYFAYDTLAYPGKRVDLAARLQLVKGFKPVRGATVGFYRGRKLIGSAKTDKDGLAKIRWTPPAAGNYKLTAKIIKVPDDDFDDALLVRPAPLLVAARDKKHPLVVIDLDHTVVDSSFIRVLLLGGGRPMAGSVKVTGKIARRYGIIYLTHRPDLLTRKSKKWLARNGYPDGPVMLSKLRDAFGDSGKFKTGRLLAVRKAYPNARIGIGDKLSDAEAYVKSGLTAYLIPHYKNKPKHMRKMAREIQQIRGRGRLQVVAGWDEIDNGIFKGARYSPDQFVIRLNRHAARLDAEKRRKKKDDDDDDDDDDNDDDD